MDWDTPATVGLDSTLAVAGDSWEVNRTAATDVQDYTTDGPTARTGNGCRNCGNEGHFAKECPEPRQSRGACFNCGEEWHSKADCPNPRVFTGTCRICEKEGHHASACPDKPAEICKNCHKEGHKRAECKENRAIDLSNVADLKPDIAWEKLRLADEAREMDEFREAFKEYIKAVPATTYEQVERAFRHLHFNTYVIAYEKEVTDSFTLMNLQGKLDCKYHVGFFFSPKPSRRALQDGWPVDEEENLQRLVDAGIPVERGIPKCSNCDEFGHISKSCPQEKVEREIVPILKCVNCNETGHRVRDCNEKRKDRFACRNCGQAGHAAAECTEPRSAANVECKNCNETGHFAKDCPSRAAKTCRNCDQEGHISKDCDKPRNPATATCRNCDEVGHFSKECPKPRDYSKVQCQNCKEMGHTKVRCKAPPADADNGGFDKNGGAFDSFGGGFNSASAGFGSAAGGYDTMIPVASNEDEAVAW